MKLLLLKSNRLAEFQERQENVGASYKGMNDLVLCAFDKATMNGIKYVAEMKVNGKYEGVWLSRVA